MLTVHNPLTGDHHPDAGHAAAALLRGEPIAVGRLTIQRSDDELLEVQIGGCAFRLTWDEFDIALAAEEARRAGVGSC